MGIFADVDFLDFVGEAIPVSTWYECVKLEGMAYPSSSSAMEILIPLGVCAVYRVMSGLLILSCLE